MACRWHLVIINSRHALTARVQSQFRFNKLDKVRSSSSFDFVLRVNSVLCPGAEDVAEQGSFGYVQHTPPQNHKHEQRQPLTRKDVSMALLHRHHSGISVVFFRLRPHGNSVLFMLSVLFFDPAVIRQQRARERHSNR